jgi:hypothetical protein
MTLEESVIASVPLSVVMATALRMRSSTALAAV